MRKIAIILAAGMGTRLKSDTEKIPKCLIKIDGKPIIRYQIDMLKKAGISKIFVVGGYLIEELRDYLQNDPICNSIVELITNKEYQYTNNMYSANLALSQLQGIDYELVYILNGDVIYEPDFLAGTEEESFSGIFVDRSMYMEESMKVLLNSEGNIVDISKEFSKKESCFISVDMYRFTKQDTETFRSKISEILSSNQNNLWTEVALSQLLSSGYLNMLPIDRTGFIWWEIDDIRDKIRASYRMKLLKKAKLFSNNKLFVFDIDGTLLLEESELPGASEFISFLKGRSKKVVYLTNNSSLSNLEHAERLSKVLKLDISEEEVFSSLDYIETYIKNNNYTKVFSLLNTKAQQQIKFINTELENPEVVLIGFDTELTYEKLAKASIYIQQGSDFLLVHPDLRCPGEMGYIPDAGSIGELIERITEKKPILVGGKPNPDMIINVASRLGVSINETVYFGDRIYTDILMVENIPAYGFLMLTGETSFEDFINEEKFRDTEQLERIYLGENFIFLGSFIKNRELIYPIRS